MDPMMELLENDAPLPEWLTAPPHTLITFDMDQDVLRRLRVHGNLVDVMRTALSSYLGDYQPTPAPLVAIQGKLESLSTEKCYWNLPHDLASRLAALGGESSDHVRAACKRFLSSPPLVPDVDEDAPDNGDGW